MKLIILPNGSKVKVDDQDYERLSKYRWYETEKGYVRTQYINGKIARIKIHRMILSDPIPRGYEIDHINRDRLDNQRSNLRICTRAENLANRSPRTKPRGPITVGITRHEYGKWQLQSYWKGINRYLGLYETKEDARIAAHVARQILASDPSQTCFV